MPAPVKSAKRSGSSRKPPPPPPRRWPWLLLRAALALAIPLALVLIYLDAYILREFSGKKWAVPALVYGRPLELYPGAPLAARALVEELKTLGYREHDRVSGQGSYSLRNASMQVNTRGFGFWDGVEPPRQLLIHFDGQGIDAIQDRGGEPVAIARLEPVHIGGIYPAHNEDRILVRVGEVPPLLVAALLAVEDKNFARHHGISLRGISRALLANVKSGAVEQGGSTLTQQLVKNFFLTRERSYSRKLAEVLMAMLLELHYSKQEILEAYLNEIYLGQDGHRAIHGFGLAAHHYFNRPLAELEPQQIALLVALVRGPSYYDPWRRPERALARRALVFKHLVDENVLKPEVAARLQSTPLGVGDLERSRSKTYPSYLDLVRRQLRADYSDKDLSSEGLQIFTALDPAIQRAAERALGDTLDRIERDYAARGKPQTGLEGAVVVTRVDSGEVLALVGGRHTRVAGFNRALDAERPIGSLVKPAVYLTALADGRYNLLTPLDDSPVAHRGTDRKIWAPRNYDRKDHGMVRLHRSLAQSYNQSTARLGLEIGVDRVIGTLHRLGIERSIPELPSVLLGAVPMSPVEVAGMYQTIASGGFGTPLRAIRDVLDSTGKPLSRYPVAVEQKVGQAAVFLLEYALQEVVRDGTARSAYRTLPGHLSVAGKTGTTDDLRDSWFAGYSGDLLAVVWIGRDDNGVTALTGATGALPVWSALMAEVSHQPLRTLLPQGMVEEWVDDLSGGLSGEDCPGARRMPFLLGTAPTYEAPCSGKRWPWSSRPEVTPQEQAQPAPADPAREVEKEQEKWWQRWFGRSD